MPVILRKYITVLCVLVVASTVFVFVKNPILSIFTVIPTLVFEATLIGWAMNPNRKFSRRTALGGFFLICWFIVSGTLLYMIRDLSFFSVIGLWITTGVLVAIYLWQRSKKYTNFSPIWTRPVATKHPAIDVLLIAIVGILDTLAFLFLIQGQTIEAIRSPWETVSPLFFVAFFFGTLALCTLAIRGNRRFTLYATILHTLVALFVAQTVYRLGYGYDLFIHQKVEELILANGEVLPKTPYYIGQYALVTIFARVTNIVPSIIDRFLVPLSYAVIFPVLLLWISEQISNQKKSGMLLVVLFPLLVPFVPFIATTPQGLSYIFAALTIAALFAWKNKSLSILPAISGTIATLAIHPLTGIPLFGLTFLFLSTATGLHSKIMRTLTRLLGGGLILTGVPAAFLLNELATQSLSVTIVNLEKPISTVRSAIQGILPIINKTGSVFLDSSYFWLAAVPIALVILSIIAVRKSKQLTQDGIILTLVGSFLLFISFLLLAFFQFGVAIDTGSTFPLRFRLLEIAVISMFPAVVFGFIHLIPRLLRGPTSRLVTITLLATLATATTYISYPRVDDIDPSHGYSVSYATQRAVELIENSGEAEYIVLANPTATAAAIQLSGFQKYYNNNFYYSHPDGSPLFYDYFLEMNKAPSHDIAAKAMDAAGVDSLFFVVHDYWKNSRDIISKSKESADDIVDIGDGRVTVFKYQR